MTACRGNGWEDGGTRRGASRVFPVFRGGVFGFRILCNCMSRVGKER